MKSNTPKRQKAKREVSQFVEGWNKVAKQKLIESLNEEEKAQFEKARFAEEQVKKSSFVLGGQINRNSLMF